MKLKLNTYLMIPDMDEKLTEIIRKAVDNRAKILERICDYATNIAEDVIYMV